MENYRTGAHTCFDIKYHFVWVTKYRKAALAGPVGNRGAGVALLKIENGCHAHVAPAA